MSNSAYLSSRGSVFERNVNPQRLSDIRRYLPPLSLDQTFTIDTFLSEQKAEPELSLQREQGLEGYQGKLLGSYFKHYGFDALSHKYPRFNYYFGLLSMVDEQAELKRDFALATHIWQPRMAKGLVFIAHGLFDHIGLYLQLVDFLLNNQYAVIAIDLPGHGLSSGDPGTITDFKDYALAVQCVNTFVRENSERLLFNEKQEQLNYFAVGQSTGCAALIKYMNLEQELKRQQTDEDDNKCLSFNKMALIAPLIRPKSWWFVRISFIILSIFLKSIKRNFTRNSHDEIFIRFISKHDPLQPTKISVEWVGAMIAWVKDFKYSKPQSLSTIIIQGTGDKTVDFSYNLPLIKKKFKHCDIKIIDHAGHHFVNESDKYRIKGFDYINTFFLTK